MSLAPAIKKHYAEITERLLANPPERRGNAISNAFWTGYDWPDRQCKHVRTSLNEAVWKAGRTLRRQHDKLAHQIVDPALKQVR